MARNGLHKADIISLLLLLEHASDRYSQQVTQKSVDPHVRATLEQTIQLICLINGIDYQKIKAFGKGSEKTAADALEFHKDTLVEHFADKSQDK